MKMERSFSMSIKSVVVSMKNISSIAISCKIMKFKPGREDSIEGLLALRASFAGDFMEGCYFNNCNDFNEIIILKEPILKTNG